MSARLFISLVLVTLSFVAVASCYDASSPLPPCRGEPWPNPCDGRFEAPVDAGRG